VTVLFADGVSEIFDELPARVQQRAAHSIELLRSHPRIYPIRRRSLMRGYRYFIAGQYLFYCAVTSTEIGMTAIIPAAMRLA
jgi:plasmid stabilization system protein ParE